MVMRAGWAGEEQIRQPLQMGMREGLRQRLAQAGDLLEGA